MSFDLILPFFRPIEHLLLSDTVSEIMVNPDSSVWIEEDGEKVHLHRIRFEQGALEAGLEVIANRFGKKLDSDSPIMNLRLPDGSRLAAIIPPVVNPHPLLTIRKFTSRKLKMEDLVAQEFVTAEAGAWLQDAVQRGDNILVSGGTGAGKTTLLNVLSGYIPNSERIVSIEDAAELQLKQENIVRLETRPPNIEGKGEIRQRELVKNALRMRPDRIIIGECRGEEAFDMLQAMNTGHEGSMTTIHANPPRDALKRLEQMVAMAGMATTVASIRSQISSAITLAIQLQRLPDGKRRVTSVSEITGMEDEVIQMQEIYRFVKESTDDAGNIHGSFMATGVQPNFLKELKAYGISLPDSHFDPSRRL